MIRDAELDRQEFKALTGANKLLNDLERNCLRMAELPSQLAAEKAVWRKAAQDLAKRSLSVHYTLHEDFKRSGDTYAIVENLEAGWISKCLRDVGTVRGIALLSAARIGPSHSHEDLVRLVSDAHEALMNLDDLHGANTRVHASAGRFKPKRYIAVPADCDSTSKIRGFGFTAEEALDRAYEAAGCRYRPFIRYDERASGEKFAHLLPVSETEGWVAFDGHANEIGVFFEEANAQRAAVKAGFIARECRQAEVMEALESGLTLAA